MENKTLQTPIPEIDFVSAQVHALRFLCDIVEGKPMMHASPEKPKELVITYPTFEQRLKVSLMMAKLKDDQLKPQNDEMVENNEEVIDKLVKQLLVQS